MKHEIAEAVGLLRLQAHEWGIELEEKQMRLLLRYAQLLVGYDLANVTGARNEVQVLLEHLPDALSCLLTGRIEGGDALIDVGTGGGLPGIPLHIARPNVPVTLVEATSKKARFLDTAIRDLGLSGLRVVNERAEILGRAAEYRDTFDVAVTRAVGALPLVLEYCSPLVKSGGTIIAMKGAPTEEEVGLGVGAAELLGARLERIQNIEFRREIVQKDRTNVVFRKTAPTPERFPRRVGRAKRRPLGHLGEA